MSWLARSLNTSLGKKVIMALTGLFLCSFLVVHLIGNLQLLKSDGGEAFNKYALFMTSNPIIKITSYILYTSILIHAIWGIILTVKNKKARPVGYAKVNNQSTWSSRNMGILGTIIFIFIAVHMQDFWWKYHNNGVPMANYEDVNSGKLIPYKDLYAQVAFAFSEPILVAFYVLAMAALAFHLFHGFQSAFQSLGLRHTKYTPFIKSFGVLFSIVVPAAFAAIPLVMYFCKTGCAVK